MENSTIGEHRTCNQLIAAASSDQPQTTADLNRLVVRMITDLALYERNSRKHSEAQVAQIAASIKEFGFTNPVLVDEYNTVIAGEGRVLAARKLKMPAVPCIVLTGLTEAQKAAYVIADNKLALNAGWDEAMLQSELSHLAALQHDLNLTGFTEVDIASLLADLDTATAELGGEEAAALPEVIRHQVENTVAVPSDVQHPKPEDAWVGMPEFNQQETGPFRTIKVHCTDQAAVDSFAKLIGRNLTAKTKYVWFPEAVKAAAVVYG